VAAEKGLRLRIRSSPVWLLSDPILLQRVLLNLVSNAVQHTHRGSVLVICRPTHERTHARIEVWDSGIGIAAQHHEKIFEEFFQVDNQERDRAKGLGLGLSIVDRSCKLLEHPMSMRSSLGRGTRFTLMIPLAQTESVGMPRMAAETPLLNEFECLHILVIEDDALGRAALEGLLASWGCRVTVAANVQMACELLRHEPPPDFIVSDYRLPGALNGIDAVRILRTTFGREIAACVISGDTDVNVRQQTLDAGLALLRKPVRPAKLRSILRNYVQTSTTDSDASDVATI
jgi:CheY-like chemotaxis protein/anti-sigma regulatory factor (Ser/Thr protein kinase)